MYLYLFIENKAVSVRMRPDRMTDRSIFRVTKQPVQMVSTQMFGDDE